MKKTYKKDGNYYNVYNGGILVGSTKNIKQLKKDGYIESAESLDGWEKVYNAFPTFKFNRQGTCTCFIETPGRGDGTTFTIEIFIGLLEPHDKKSRGAYLFKKGYLKNKDITSVIYMHTYYHDNKGNCTGRYNPSHHMKGGRVLIDPETTKTATPENIIYMIQKTYDLYIKGGQQ